MSNEPSPTWDHRWPYSEELPAVATHPALDTLRVYLPAVIRSTRRECVEDLVAAGWSRYRIAQELGVSRQAVAGWEKPKP